MCAGPPRDRAAHRRPDRARLRLRLDPARPRCAVHRAAAARPTSRSRCAASSAPTAPSPAAPSTPRSPRMSRVAADEAGDAAPRAGARGPPGGPLVAGRRGQAAPRRDARLLAAAAADDRPDRRGPQRRGAGGVRPGVPLLPLRRHQDAAVRRRRRRRRRPRSGLAAQVAPLRQPAAQPDPAGGGARRAAAPGEVLVHRRLRRPRPGGRPCTPGSRAATPATTRPPRCSPSRRCAWPSTTTRRPPARSPRPSRWASNLPDRLQRAGIGFEVVPLTHRTRGCGQLPRQPGIGASRL